MADRTLGDRTEYYDSWDKYAKDTAKVEAKEAAAKKDRDQEEAMRDAMKPRNTGYEFRTGHKTKFPDIPVLEGESDESAAFRVAGERRQAGIESFTKERSQWGAQQAVDAWGQGLLALERLKNLRKYKPLKAVSTEDEAAEPVAPPELDPTDEQVVDLMVAMRLNLAQALLDLKEYQACVAHCEKALEFDPCNVKALWRKASAVWKTRNPGVAREALERLLEVDEGNPAAVKLMMEIELEEQKKRAKRTGVQGTSQSAASVPRPRRPQARDGGGGASTGLAGEELDESGGSESGEEEEVGFWAGFFAWLGKVFCRRRQKQD